MLVYFFVYVFGFLQKGQCLEKLGVVFFVLFCFFGGFNVFVFISLK